MVAVRELTEEQAELLIGKIWGMQGQFFNVQIDANGKKFISNEKVKGCTLAQAQLIGCDSWLLTLPEIDYNPIIVDRF